MKLFKAKYKKGKGLFSRISLVENPAIEENFITLSKEEEIIFVLSNEEKREILTPILIPNKPIFRKAQGNILEDFYISFDAETVKDITYDLIANKELLFSSNHTETILEGIEIQQVFLSSAENGINPVQFKDLPTGTLFAVLKVNNDTVWNEIKEGTFKGVSVEIQAGLEEELEKSTEEQMQRIVDLINKYKS